MNNKVIDVEGIVINVKNYGDTSKIIDIFTTAFADVSMRGSQLTIHCSYDCKNFNYYYYRNKAEEYNAVYKEWDGSSIQ